MNNCEKYEELISCLIDNELSDEDRIDLMLHIENCPSCREYYETISHLFAGENFEMVPPPESLASSVMSKVNAAGAPRPAKKRPTVTTVTKYLAIAACAAIVFLAVPQLFNGFGMKNASDAAPEYTGVTTESVTEGASPSEESFYYEAEKEEDIADSEFEAPGDSQEADPDIYDRNDDKSDQDVPDSAGSNSNGVSSLQPLNDYYAVVNIENPIPNQLSESDFVYDPESNIYYAEISCDLADTLFEEGHSVKYTENPKLDYAVVLYKPGS